MSELRRASVHDLPGTYRVCLETGDNGGDATALYRNPDLLGHVFVGPYVVGKPAIALVVADADGVAGYLLATPDTVAFAHWADRHWWPDLRRQYPRRSDDTRDAEIVRLIHEPPLAPEPIVAEFPAHLHIDLLARTRGRGLGRALIDRLMDELARRGTPAVHLEVGVGNENAIEFYRHLGFAELERTADSIYMGLHLATYRPARLRPG